MTSFGSIQKSRTHMGSTTIECPHCMYIARQYWAAKYMLKG